MSEKPNAEPETPVEFAPVNVIIFPRGQLSQTDRNVLTAAGFLAVEADDPSRVVTVLPHVKIVAPISGDEIFEALLEAVSGNDFAGGMFGRALILRLKNAHTVVRPDAGGGE